MRPGATALSVLSVPLNVHVLRALDDGNQLLADLSRAVGHPPASTLRSYLRTLTQLDVVERRPEADFPGSVSYVLTPAGQKLLRVAQVLEDWLQEAPEGPIALASPAAKSATKALVEGWSSRIVRAVAAKPLTLTELDRLIPQISYPTLERRLTAMRRVGLLQAQSNGSARGTPYRATRWLRQAVAPLTAAIGWERRCAPDETSPLGRIDIEAAFLLAVPLLELPDEASGSCRLAVEIRNGSATDYAGVVVTVEEGRPTSCISRLSEAATAWAVGGALDWFGWVNGRDGHELDLGGDASLATTLVEALLPELVPSGSV